MQLVFRIQLSIIVYLLVENKYEIPNLHLFLPSRLLERILIDYDNLVEPVQQF